MLSDLQLHIQRDNKIGMFKYYFHYLIMYRVWM